MSIFEEVKNRTDMKSVAVHYGYAPNRSGYICCPFHSDKTPSLKLYQDSFYCFGCNTGGSVLDFVMKLYDMSVLEAAKKLNSDLSLGVDTSGDISIKPSENVVSTSQMLMHYDKWEKRAFRVLENYYRLLKILYRKYAPQTPDDEPDPAWFRICRELPVIESYCMIFIEGDENERKRFYISKRKEVEHYDAEFRKYVS